MTDEGKSEINLREEKILEFWDKEQIFEKSLTKPAPKGDFVFYEGPPTANGRPGVHHMESRSFKDALPRYKTMRGYRVPRRAGWDTHGLPVELEVEKQLGFQGKKDIEAYGIAAYNKKCRESVMTYINEWRAFSERIGYWVNQDKAYFTFNAPYMESVWSVMKKVSDDGRLYKDYKVLPWCVKCGTALSSHELAQGYEDVKDLSLTVKFKLRNPEKLGLDGDVYFLAWTTTPWTLPGNVGLAVGENISYEAFITPEHSLSVKNETYIAAVRSEQGGNGPIRKTLKGMSGKELVGLEYEPLYSFAKDVASKTEVEKFENAYKVYAADFVTTEDGTGIVHTAVMYGQDDFELGTAIGLPKFHLVKEDGHFLDTMDFLSGRYVKEVDEKGKPTLAVDIIDDLKKRNLFFSQENIKHSYPHCWRCKTALIYYARDSWYIRMSSLREELMSENKDIHWEPKHIKEGRFGEWLREIKDWAISRERYWGTPLPIWTNPQGEYRVVGSIDELKALTQKSGNTYFIVRHGEAQNNVRNILSSSKHDDIHLTEHGREQVRISAELLKEKGITKIIASPFVRTRETAEIIKEVLGFSGDIIFDDRLGEHNLGVLSGGPIGVYHDLAKTNEDRYEIRPENGENLIDVKKRTGELLYEIEKTYKGECILYVTHEHTTWALESVAQGFNKEQTVLSAGNKERIIQNAEFRELKFVPLPHNENYELDIHRPYIDGVVLVDEKGQSLTRVKEVMDVWFDSGSMPFAQINYPFSHEELLYPADFISEAIDQTRGWFYTLHAIGVLMGKGKAYKNVICLGHILDAEGKKMSKSIGNIVNPNEMMDLYGVDALRLWMYSVNQPGDSKNFDPSTVDEIVKKVFNPTRNILAFYELYADDDTKAFTGTSNHILDQWIISRLNEVIREGTRSLENYQVFEYARLIRDFVNDFSTWYVRRSRDRFKSENREEKKEALATTRFVLQELVKYMAPFTPFFAEDVYRTLRLDTDPESVHLAQWPEAGEVNEKLIADMQKVRETVTRVLELRSKANIKVRQPLASLVVKEDFSSELRTIIAEEVNVKEVVSDSSMTGDLELDTTLTPDLIEEGIARDLIRAIQDARKKENLLATQTIDLSLSGIGTKFLNRWGVMIQKPTGIKTITTVEALGTHTLTLDNLSISFSLVY